MNYGYRFWVKVEGSEFVVYPHWGASGWPFMKRTTRFSFRFECIVQRLGF
jgi:hypothetical protein